MSKLRGFSITSSYMHALQFWQVKLFQIDVPWPEMTAKVETMWKLSSGLLHFCPSESSKKSTFFTLEKSDGQASRIVEMQKSAI